MLEVDNVRAGYGAINVLWDVTLSVAKGQLTTIIGPNGAGKTTLLRAIMGLLPVSQGGIRYNGKALNGTSTWDMLGLGMAMIPEGRMIFRDRKSTRLNSSHSQISYAVFCLKKKKKNLYRRGNET